MTRRDPVYTAAYNLAYPLLMASKCDEKARSRLVADLVVALSVTPGDANTGAVIKQAVDDAYDHCRGGK